MAFVLTPRFAPAYQAQQCNPFGYCAPISRPSHGYRVSRPQPRRPQYSPYNSFFSQVDELLSEIDREAQRQAQIEAHREALREAYRQRQLQRKRALRAEFQVNQVEQGWQVDGDIQGFNQDNINIEVIDEQTLKIAGNTHWQSEQSQQQPQQPQQPQIEAEPTPAPNDEQPAATQSEPEVETTTEADTTTAGAATPDSDTASHQSYQPTVEDDFEDLAADFPNSRPSSPTEPREPKGKEKVVEEPVSTESAVVAQPQPEVPVQQPREQPQQQERVHGSFERTFRFPERIDASNVSASFKDGVLKVTVPRAQAPQVRRIAIL
jgi:HSP20 family molecular chaperone IbpA